MKLSLKVAVIGAIVLIADLLSKYLVQRYIPIMDQMSLEYPYNGIGIFRNFFGIEFSVIHATNTGAAWGMFRNFQIPLLILRMILVIGLLVYLMFWNSQKSWRIPLTLITVGAIGNIIDAFLYGHVIDMFNFVLWGYDYPVFNVADSAIFIGVFMIAISGLIGDFKEHKAIDSGR